MKHLLLCTVLLAATAAWAEVMEIKVKLVVDGGAASTVLTLDSTDVRALADVLPSFEVWLKDAVKGKRDNCVGHMRERWTPYVDADSTITDRLKADKKFVSAVVKRPWYLNRAQRDSARVQ